MTGGEVPDALQTWYTTETIFSCSRVIWVYGENRVARDAFLVCVTRYSLSLIDSKLARPKTLEIPLGVQRKPWTNERSKRASIRIDGWKAYTKYPSVSFILWRYIYIYKYGILNPPTPKKTTVFSWWLVAMWLATCSWVADCWQVASHRSPVTSHQGFNHQVASHQNGGWLWLVAGGWWIVASLL